MSNATAAGNEADALPWRGRVLAALAGLSDGASVSRLVRALADGVSNYDSLYRRIYQELRASERDGYVQRAYRVRLRLPFAWGAETTAATGPGRPAITWQLTPDGASYLAQARAEPASQPRQPGEHSADAVPGDAAASLTPGERCARWLFPRDPAEVRCARRQVRNELAAWGLAEHTDLLELVTSEIVTNAVRHGDGKVEVRLAHVGCELRLSVHDDGAGRPAAGEPDLDAERGRGLTLISAMIEPYGGTVTVTADQDSPGKTVHVAITLAPGGEDSP